MEKTSQKMVYCQEIDISSGHLPLALLRQAVAEAPQGGRKLQDIGLVKDGDRVLIKLYYTWPGDESE
ncbi:MAG: hypothetical protein ACOX2G_04040 [Bacillota bacterium]|jgi:hypothetical protein